MPVSEREVSWLLAEKYGGIQTPEFERDRQRLADGEPVAYVIGFSDFLGCHIDLSHRPLIPRPETEFWVENMIAWTREESADRPIRCLDIFSGSGCVGLALLKHVPNATADFADSDPLAIEQVRINLEKNEIAPERARVIQSDVFETIEGRYDYIFANPPYIAKNGKDRVQTSVEHWEPPQALWGGEDGLLHIRRFLDEVSRYLTPGGILAMEFDDIQKDAITEHIKENIPLSAEFFKDQYGLFRWLVAG